MEAERRARVDPDFVIDRENKAVEAVSMVIYVSMW
jgi:hypothetical protein